MGFRERLLRRVSAVLPDTSGPGAPSVTAEKVYRGLRLDSMLNAVTALGGVQDKGSAFTVDTTRRSLTLEELTFLYRYNGLARRIVELAPGDAMRKGWRHHGVQPYEAARLDKRLRIRKRVHEARIWSRAYGGSILFPVIDQKSAGIIDLEEPLDLDNIKHVHAIHALDAWMAWPDTYEYDVMNPDHNEPEFWIITLPDFSARVHRSRVIYMDGTRRPRGWSQVGGGTGIQTRMPGDSIIQAVYDEIGRLTTISQAGSVLAQELSQAVLKVGDADGKKVGSDQATFFQFLRLLAQQRSLLNMVVLDESDDLQLKGANVQGYTELSKHARTMLCAVTGHSEQRLFGTAPSGLNADGESGWETENRLIAEERLVIEEAAERLYDIVYSAEDSPDASPGRHITWEPMSEPTELEVAKVREIIAKTDEVRINSGVLSPDECRKRYLGPTGFITDLDLGEDDITEHAPPRMDADITNFPEEGDDEKVSLANSNYARPPAEYVRDIKENWPQIWSAGGNIKGNDQYRDLTMDDPPEHAIRRREAWAARHYRNHRLAGVVACLKWLVVPSRGMDHVRKVINDEKKRLKED